MNWTILQNRQAITIFFEFKDEMWRPNSSSNKYNKPNHYFTIVSLQSRASAEKTRLMIRTLWFFSNYFWCFISITLLEYLNWSERLCAITMRQNKA